MILKLILSSFWSSFWSPEAPRGGKVRIVEKVEIYYTHHKSYRAYVKVKVSKENIDTPMDKIRLDDKLVATIKTQEINNPISGKELNKIKAKKKAKKIKNIINNLWNSH